MTRRSACAAILLAAGFLTRPSSGLARGQDATGQVFRGGVEVVRVAAFVQDRHGRPVTGLSAADFELFDGGEPRPIIEFHAERTPISVAVLVDGSGSMGLEPRQERARDVVHHLLSWIEPGTDEVALLTFDSALSILQPFTTTPPLVARHLGRLAAFGQTSLYDAIARTSQEIAGPWSVRQAIAVVTDGIDTSSRLDPIDVARVASMSDVPVYVLAVDPAAAGRATGPTSDGRASLDDLARWTGGGTFVVDTQAGASLAARQIVTELRHHYLIGIEAGAGTGWHAITIRTRRAGLAVRARSGYMGGAVIRTVGPDRRAGHR